MTEKEEKKDTASVISNTQVIKIIVNELKEKYNIVLDEAIKLVEEKGIILPISIFDNKELSCLETICRYLKDNLGLNYHKIALILNRNDRTIWTTYNNSLKKRKPALKVLKSKFTIPISIFAERKLSVLESITHHLKENYDLSYGEISKLLNRDERNIWTVFNRAKNKIK